MRWTSLPAPLDAAPGLIRWTPVDGVTAYQVWYLEPNKIFKTQTTVADEREYYTFHQDPTWTGTIHWRIRAVRALYGNVENGLPAVSYGPWSAVYTSTNTPFATGPLTDVETISDSVSTAATPSAHHVMPAFAYTGDRSPIRRLNDQIVAPSAGSSASRRLLPATRSWSLPLIGKDCCRYAKNWRPIA